MSKPNEEPEANGKLTSWLDTLQQESWQLELIVSGVVIFLLLGGYGPLVDIHTWFFLAQMGDSSFVTMGGVFMGFLRFSYLLLIGMFLIHLGLRGVWIGAIGLRSVSGGFDHEALNYQPKFSSFLQKRLGSFDDYIAVLEKNASVTFSLAFLLFFAILSVGFFFVALTSGIFIISGFDGQIDSSEVGFSKYWFYGALGLAIAWATIMILAGLSYFIDFITFGWLKRRPWFHRIHYPFYRFMGWFTLARLYRPVYYNIIDNRFGKRLVGAYLITAFLSTFAMSFDETSFSNFAYTMRQEGVVHAGNYVDTGDYRSSSERNFYYPSLGSRMATSDYLEVFVPSNSKRYKRVLKKRFPDLKPLAENSISLSGFTDLQDLSAAQIDTTLTALTAIIRVSLNDSLLTGPRWQFYRHPVRNQPGLLYDLPVYDLPRGGAPGPLRGAAY